jgi:DNA-directed RNA polymerase subunit E'/Rpb7
MNKPPKPNRDLAPIQTAQKEPKDGAITEQNNEGAVSPATRLLEKRRMMYENQENYKSKKRDFTKEETQFKAREQELRDKDNEIQGQLIEFASYLDGNQR